MAVADIAVSPADARRRVLELLRRHGRNATSFQCLEEGFQYWFDDDACVAYVEVAGAWVVAGAPICAAERLAEVTRRFIAAARAERRRCSFFAAESRLVCAAGLDSTMVGEQPVWDPQRWSDSLAGSRSLREQLRRARAKGVNVRVVDATELHEGAPIRERIEALIERWQHGKQMAPMGFLVDVQLFAFARERRYFVAEHDDTLMGFLAAVPVFAREGWLLEDFLRDPSAPNGTAELLVDAAMHALAGEGSSYVTLGLAPLSGALPGSLQLIRRVSAGLYDFEGLRAFKKKLRPHEWIPIYLGHPRGTSGNAALLDVLAAFARGGFLRFGVATLLRGPAFVVRVLAALLVPWIVLLSLADPRWFPSELVRRSWIGFDVALVAALFSLTDRWRRTLGIAVALAVSSDVFVTMLQLVGFNAKRARGGDWLVLLVSATGPLFAAVLLWLAILHRHRLDAD